MSALLGIRLVVGGWAGVVCCFFVLFFVFLFGVLVCWFRLAVKVLQVRG